MVKQIEAGKATWNDLFEKSDFFFRYKWYLQVTVRASTQENLSAWYEAAGWRWCPGGGEGGETWLTRTPRVRFVRPPHARRGFTESRLRSFIQNLERAPMVTLAVPFPDSFDVGMADESEQDSSTAEKPKCQSSFFLGLVLDKPHPSTAACAALALWPAWPRVDADLTGRARASAWCAGGAGDTAQHRVLDLSTAVNMFLQLLFSWDRWQEDMGIDIRHLKRHVWRRRGRVNPWRSCVSRRGGPRRIVCWTM